MRVLLAALAGLFLLVSPALAAPVDTGHLEAELIAQERVVAPGGTTYVALRQKIDKGWHTYWRNSGDSGEPTKIKWTLPSGWTAGDIVWPAPQALPFGPLTNYGYSGEVLLAVPITVPADARPGSKVMLTAAAGFLVCEKICIPEDAVLTLELTVGDPAPDPKWGQRIAEMLAAAPKPAGLTAAYEVGPDGSIRLGVVGGPLKALTKDAYFFPYQSVWIEHAKPQTVEGGPEGLTLKIAPGYAFEAGQPPEAMDGVLVVCGKSYEIRAVKGALPAGSSGQGPATQKCAADGQTATADGGIGLLAAMGLAFLGGLILNLMPCVFPVLSMKAASLAGHAHEAKAARAQGIAYGVGVVLTFLALAGLLIAFKAAGAAVGWGFQLQSPPVIAGLALLMLAVAMNMSGVFEVGGFQGAGQGLAGRGGMIGAFFTGVLAVVVASPCTAPFMGTALGFTLSQPPLVTLLVFLGLALGFAAPFVLLAFAPALLRRLPKPSGWMDVLRKALAFPMYGAAAWLVWVLAQQTDLFGLAAALAALVALSFFLWLYGLTQSRLWRIVGGVGVLAVFLAAVLNPYPQPATTGTTEALAADVPSEAWSPERLASLRSEGKVVLVNFTAAWCVTCQVNEKVALSTAEVAEAMKATNAVYLKGDWTRRDPVIAAALTEHGRAGVPLYLVYSPASEKPKVLPQLLTPGLVAQALQEAGKKQGS